MPDFNAVSLQSTIARRWFLKDCGARLEAVAATKLLEDSSARAADAAGPKPSHFPGKEKNVLFLFMASAPSHQQTSSLFLSKVIRSWSISQSF